ncbi:MAG: CPBP family intramembrane glutamic endopeptidase [Syntrophothermus sp.]
MDAVESVKGKDFDRRLFSLLLVMNIIAALLSIPYVNVLSGKPAIAPYKLIIIIPFQIITTLIIFSFIISVGINLSVRYGFDEPFLKSFLYKRDYPDNTKQSLSRSFLAGIALGICLMILSFTGTHFFPIPSAKHLHNPGPLYGFLVSVSAGISEETLFRFCLLQVFIWLGGFLVKGEYVRSAGVLFWTANFLSGIIFGMAHISNLAVIGADINISTVGITVTLNLIAGMTFGYLFFKYGLLSAIIAHFSTDLVLHVIVPALM